MATFEAQFMKMLNNTEAELNKSVAYRKKACSRTCTRVSCAGFSTNDEIWRNRVNRCSMHG